MPRKTRKQDSNESKKCLKIKLIFIVFQLVLSWFELHGD